MFQGGGVIDLKANGSNVVVTADNVVEYIYRYVEMRMLKNAAKALEVKCKLVISFTVRRL